MRSSSPYDTLMSTRSLYFYEGEPVLTLALSNRDAIHELLAALLQF